MTRPSLIALLVFITGTSVSAQEPKETPAASTKLASRAVESSTNAVAEEPELLYLGWAEEGERRDIGTENEIAELHGPRQFWNARGELAPEDVANELSLMTKPEMWWNRAGRLASARPLILVFRTNPKIRGWYARSAIIDGDGNRHSDGQAASSSELALQIELGMRMLLRQPPLPSKQAMTRAEFAVSEVRPKSSHFAAWPSRISLDLEFPAESMQLLKTVTEFPEKPIELAEGIEWLFEDRPDWLKHHDRNRPLGVLRYNLAKADLEQNSYDIRIFAHGRPMAVFQDLCGQYNEYDKDHPGTYQICYFDAIMKRTDVKRIEVWGRRLSHSRINNIALRLDLLDQK